MRSTRAQRARQATPTRRGHTRPAGRRVLAAVATSAAVALLALAGPAAAPAQATSAAAPLLDPAPVVTGVSPAYGAAGSAGNATITISGSGFTGATSVNFGSSEVADPDVVSDTEIEVTPPELDATSTTAVDVTVSAPGGTSATSPADRYSYLAYTPLPTGDATGTLTAVSCLDATDCLAVGYSEEGSAHAIAEQLAGSSFEPIATPSVAAGDWLVLLGVSCAGGAGGDCVAVGDVQGSGDAIAAVVEYSAATSSWGSVQTFPSIASGYGYSFFTSPLTSVSCTGTSSLSSCVAVGYAETSGCDETFCSFPIGLDYDGSSWSPSNPEVAIERYESAGEALNSILSVSCATATQCTAVGFDDGELFNGEDYEVQENALIESFDGSSWSIQSNPYYDTFAEYTTLSSVSCTSGDDCTAVGGGEPGAVILADDGSGWTTETQSSDLSSLASIACGPDGTCFAFAGYGAIVSGPNGYSEVPATAEGGGGTELAAASCPADGGCIVVGGYGLDYSGGGFPLAETDLAGSYDPQVVEVSPSTGQAGTAGESVDVYGVGLSGETAVDFGSAAATSVSVQSDNELVVGVPEEGAGTVDVTVTTASGTSAESAEDQYSYVQPTEVSGVSPESTGYGEDVTISGAGFTGATQVLFGSVAASSFNVVSDSDISATVPQGSGTVDVRVTSPQGISAVSAADQYTFVSPPAVTSVSPDAELYGGTSPTQVTITGTGFTGATEVDIVSNSDDLDDEIAFDVVSDTEITATVPSDQVLDTGAGIFDLVVTTLGGPSPTTTDDEFYVVQAPAVDAVSPEEDSTEGGERIEIDGSGFVDVTAVDFGSVPAASFTVESENEIEAVDPPAAAGTVDVTVSNGAATSALDNDDQFTYLPGPVVDSVSPGTVSPSAGGTVTLTGSGFDSLESVDDGPSGGVFLVGYTSSWIQLDGWTVSSDTSMTVNVPPLPQGALSDVGAVVVYNNEGAISSDALTSADELTYGAALYGLDPPAGPLAGGNQVAVAGTGLLGAEQVDFGSTPAPSFQVVSDNELVATAPAGSAGDEPVEVVTTEGSSSPAAPGDDSYDYLDPPAVNGVDPSTAAPGTWVELSGSDLASTTAVDFTGPEGGDDPANFYVVSDGEVEAYVPPGSGTVQVLVTTLGGTSAPGPGNQFTFATTGSGTASTAAGGSPGSGSPGSGSPGGGSPGGSGAAPSSGSGGSAPGSGGSAPGGAGAPASGSPPSSTSRVSRAVGRASVVPRTFSHRSGPGGSVLVRIDLSCPAGRRCDGTARLVLERSPGSAGRWRPEVLGSCTFSVAPAHRGAVGFTVPAAEARLLARSTGGELVLDLRSGRLVTSLVLGAA